MLNKRLSTPRTATVIALAAVIAAAVAVTPSFAGSFLTNQEAAKVYVTNKKASALFLRKKAASNLFVAKADAPLQPIASIAAGTAPFGPVSATTAGYIPTAFTSFSTKGIAPAVVTFSGAATCTATTATADLACPVQILIDGQSTGKVNFAPATTASPTPAALVHTITQTTVLGKGGHTVAIQYAGASKVTFTLKNWNLAVQAYPQAPETPTTTDATGK
jgi:hypothetical protein